MAPDPLDPAATKGETMITFLSDACTDCGGSSVEDHFDGEPPAPCSACAGTGRRVIEQYHPDPEINAGIAADALDAERADLAAGFPPRRWQCPDCGASHGRGHFGVIGNHRCLGCGYAGPGGVMFGTSNPVPPNARR